MTEARADIKQPSLPDAVDAALKPDERDLLIALLDPSRDSSTIANALLIDAAANRPAN
jgi:hypothetical protein